MTVLFQILNNFTSDLIIYNIKNSLTQLLPNFSSYYKLKYMAGIVLQLGLLNNKY